MKDLKEILGEHAFAKAEKTPSTNFQKPMLATLTKDYFDDENWIYERKLDGVRSVIVVKKGKVELYSRNEKPLTNTYPEIVAALEDQLKIDLVMDGEIVAFDGKVTSFSKLQDRMQTDREVIKENPDVKVYLYIFDIMQYGDYDITQLELNQRKKILKELNFSEPIRRTAHRRKNGKAYHEEACQKNWEGVIAKDATATYVHSRSKKWLKFKCTSGQELVIGGYTTPEGERIGFGALLVGFYQDEKLKYAGKVGTGYDDDFLESFSKKLKNIKRKTSPFADFDPSDADIHFVTPKYVGEFSFTEWTDNNKLRHPSFLGLRNDKEPEEIIKEQ